MVSADGKVVSFMLSAPANTDYWLIGWDCSYIINIIPCISKSEASSFLPGGIKLIGKFFSSESNHDFLSLSHELSLSTALFITRAEDKLQAFFIDSSAVLQKDVNIRPVPFFTTLYSKTIVPVFSLETPNCWFLNKSVLYSMNGQIFSESEAGTWSSLGLKGKSLVSVEVFYEITTDEEDLAPIVEIRPTSRSYSLQISWCTSVLESFSLSEALSLHLHKLKEIIGYLISTLQRFPLKCASFYCFANDFVRHPINVAYFYDSWDEEGPELEGQRRRVHEIFTLPNNWPLVRSNCSIKEFEGFRDVHLQLMEPKANDIGAKYAVKGHYAYFHYAQDGFDDKGWGCAYRSLQTLISWLKEQNFFHNEIPSHYQIQKILVEAGDKPKEFIGSKEWIGAFEVMLILDTYCKVSCKILNLSSGAEFASKGRELVNHFSNEGSPVMIGGGVLAYTLLGIDYNEDTGDCRFLILDPHYVGNDNLNTIIQKGWCGWKASDIFRNDCFYNLCMPQRPKYI